MTRYRTIPLPVPPNRKSTPLLPVSWAIDAGRIARLPLPTRHLLVVLAARTSRKSWTVEIAKETLATLTGLSRQQVRAGLLELERRNLVRPEPSSSETPVGAFRLLHGARSINDAATEPGARQ